MSVPLVCTPPWPALVSFRASKSTNISNLINSQPAYFSFIHFTHRKAVKPPFAGVLMQFREPAAQNWTLSLLGSGVTPLPS